jgi:hypothetical protein
MHKLDWFDGFIYQQWQKLRLYSMPYSVNITYQALIAAYHHESYQSNILFYGPVPVSNE